jgi:hypothetical protein
MTAARMHAPTKATPILPQKPGVPATKNEKIKPPSNTDHADNEVADLAVTPAARKTHTGSTYR